MPEPAFANPTDGYEMALIPAGKALFGEDPQFELEIPPFYMGLFCVTNAQYAAFLNAARPGEADLRKWMHLVYWYCHVVARGSEYGVDEEERYGDHPVSWVTCYGAEAYCEWAGLRLPTELEWEKGARGPDGLAFPWGNEWDPTKCRHGYVNHDRPCRVSDYPEGRSPYGMYNMSGNVWEWTADGHEEAAYTRYAAGDLTPPHRGSSTRTVRGGTSTGTRAAARNHSATLNASGNIGFRCARDA